MNILTGLFHSRAIWLGSFLALLSASFLAGADEAASKPPRKAALFVDNRAGAQYDNKVMVLDDFISSRVSSLGFQVINKETALNFVRNYDPARAATAKQEITGADIDRMLTDNTSVLRLAQNMGADLVLSVSISSVGSKKVDFQDNPGDVRTINETHTVRLSYKVVEAWTGGASLGDSISESETIRTTPNSATEDTDLINRLLDKGSQRVVESIEKKKPLIGEAPAKPGLVKVTITPRMTDLANVPVTIPDLRRGEDGKVVVTSQRVDVQPIAVTVELDGAAIGSAPAVFSVAPGLHKLRLTREGFTDWARTVNLYDGQVLDVSLQMSEAGYGRWRDNLSFLQGLETDRKLTDAEVKVLEGKAEMLRQSFFKIDIKGDALNKNTLNVIK